MDLTQMLQLEIVKAAWWTGLGWVRTVCLVHCVLQLSIEPSPHPFEIWVHVTLVSNDFFWVLSTFGNWGQETLVWNDYFWVSITFGNWGQVTLVWNDLFWVFIYLMLAAYAAKLEPR